MNQFNRFNLPLCLVVEEGVFEHVDETVASYLPEIKGQKTIIVTEQFLNDLYPDYLSEMRKDFGNSEIYLSKEGSFDQAVELAKYICIHNIKVVIGFGGGRVLDVANMPHLSARRFISVCRRL